MKHEQNQGCDEIQQEISFSLDDGLPLSAKAVEHLQGCDACRRFARYCQSESTGVLAQPIAGPSELERLRVERLVESVEQERGRLAENRWRQSIRSWARVGIAAALVLSCGYWMMELGPRGAKSVAHGGGRSSLTESIVKHELGAIQNDLHQGAQELGAPYKTLRGILNQ